MIDIPNDILHNIHDLSISVWIYLENGSTNANPCFLSMLDENDLNIAFFCFKNLKFIYSEYLNTSDWPSRGVWFHYVAVRNTAE